VAEALTRAGHDAVHVRQRGIQRAPDDVVFDLAAQEDRCVISADTDFATILAERRQSKPSVILFRRRAERRPELQVALLLKNLPELTDALATGSIVVFEMTRIRIRSLPLGETSRTKAL
jgi:predicted nuclease of predicted toxin-antitoxin system